MRSRSSAKKAGTAFETEMAKYLTVKLGVLVERRVKTGSKDPGDLKGLTFQAQSIAAECKSPGKNSPLQISQWWKEVEKEQSNIGGIAGVLFVRQYGKPLDQSFCVINKEMWDVFQAEEKLGTFVNEYKALPFDTWRENLDIGKVIKCAKYGSKGKDFWYVITVHDACTLFDSEDDLPQVYLGDIDMFLLQETGRVIVTSSHGKQIAINMVDADSNEDD